MRVFIRWVTILDGDVMITTNITTDFIIEFKERGKWIAITGYESVEFVKASPIYNTTAYSRDQKRIVKVKTTTTVEREVL